MTLQLPTADRYADTDIYSYSCSIVLIRTHVPDAKHGSTMKF